MKLKAMAMKPEKLFYVFVSIFLLERAHTTKGFEKYGNNSPKEMFLLR